MTPQEQIAYLREWGNRNLVATLPCILAVCDLAERALLTDDEAEVLRRWLKGPRGQYGDWSVLEPIFRRLLPDERVEHRLPVFHQGGIVRERITAEVARRDRGDAPVRVMPRSPLVAHRVAFSAIEYGWSCAGGDWTNAEFAAHFVPADAYERLIAAVAWIALCHHEARVQSAAAFMTSPPLSTCSCDLCAAYRAFVGGD